MSLGHGTWVRIAREILLIPTLLCYGDQGAGKTYKVPGYFPGTIDNTDKELN